MNTIFGIKSTGFRTFDPTRMLILGRRQVIGSVRPLSVLPPQPITKHAVTYMISLDHEQVYHVNHMMELWMTQNIQVGCIKHYRNSNKTTAKVNNVPFPRLASRRFVWFPTTHCVQSWVITWENMSAPLY